MLPRAEIDCVLNWIDLLNWTELNDWTHAPASGGRLWTGWNDWLTDATVVVVARSYGSGTTKYNSTYPLASRFHMQSIFHLFLVIFCFSSNRNIFSEFPLQCCRLKRTFKVIQEDIQRTYVYSYCQFKPCHFTDLAHSTIIISFEHCQYIDIVL